MALIPLDLETTGLDQQNDRILECAWGIYFDDVTEHLRGIQSRVVRPVGDTLDLLKANDFVLQMHTKTGLAANLMADDLLLLEDVEEQILNDIEAGVPDDEDCYLLGASVHFDLGFIRTWMPRLAKRLSHRVYDTSTLKLALGGFLDLRVENEGQHRAGSDVMESITVAQRVQEAFSWAQFVIESHTEKELIHLDAAYKVLEDANAVRKSL